MVLLPETAETEPDAEKADYDEDNEAEPITDDEEMLRRTGGRKGKSYAERLPKARRAEKLARYVFSESQSTLRQHLESRYTFGLNVFPSIRNADSIIYLRVTAYCTAQAYKMKNTAAFLKDHHGARTKLYDDCLYTVYHLPLIPGKAGYRLRSSPVLKSPGGKALLDEEIERSEGRDYGEGYFEEGEGENYGVRAAENESPRNEHPKEEVDYQAQPPQVQEPERPASPAFTPSHALRFAEMFVFSYGVVVFWNFTEHQEKDILADLTFSEAETGMPLVTGPQDEDDFETEEFHFEYNPDIPRPRVFNDMITLRSGDHMIKLAMSHAIAQSTKLSVFEQRMADQMTEVQHVPKRLALSGTLGLKREEVVKILGALFKSRVDFNIC